MEMKSLCYPPLQSVLTQEMGRVDYCSAQNLMDHHNFPIVLARITCYCVPIKEGGSVCSSSIALSSNPTNRRRRICFIWGFLSFPKTSCFPSQLLSQQRGTEYEGIQESCLWRLL